MASHVPVSQTCINDERARLQQVLLAFHNQAKLRAMARDRDFIDSLKTAETQRIFFALPFAKKSTVLAGWLTKAANPTEILAISWLHMFIDGIRNSKWKAAYKAADEEREFMAVVSNAFAKAGQCHSGAPKSGTVAKNIEHLLHPERLIELGFIYDETKKATSAKEARKQIGDIVRATNFKIGGEFICDFITKSKPLPSTLNSGDLSAIIKALDNNIDHVDIKWREDPIDYAATSSDVASVISWWTALKEKFLRSPEYLQNRDLFGRYLMLPANR